MTQRNKEVAALARAVMALLDTGHRRVSAALDLTRVQVLGLVLSRGRVRPAEIVDALGLTKSAVSRHLTALQAAGQVRVEDDPADARTFFVLATDQGRGEADAAVAAGTHRFATALEDWTDEEIAEARVVVERLLASWSAEHARPTPDPATQTRPRWSHRRPPEGDPR